jgi:Protein of unknown function (DUF3467)
MSRIGASPLGAKIQRSPTTFCAFTGARSVRGVGCANAWRLILSPVGISSGHSAGHLIEEKSRFDRTSTNRGSSCDLLPSQVMSDDPTSGKPQLQIQIDDDIAQGVYSNLVLLNHTENEFVLDFAFIQPSNGRAKVRTRVISSPRHTKRLLQALQKNLERYEERFGTIDVGAEDDPVFH